MMMNDNIPQGYKASALGVIPIDWEVKRLGEVCKYAKLGGNYNNSDNISEIPLIKMGNIGRGKIQLDKILYLGKGESFDKSDILQYGDLLFNTRNTLELVGKVAIWRDELPFALYNSNLLKLHFEDKHIVNNFFANYLLNSSRSIASLRGFATGTTSVAAIYNRDLFMLQLALPPLAEQERIAEVLGTWDVAIEKQGALVKKLTERKRALMQQLLTARKRLPNFSAPWQTVKLGEIGVLLKGKGVPKDKITSSGSPCLTYGDIYTKFDYVIKNISQYINDDTASESQEIIKGDILFAGSGETLQDIGKNVAFIDDTPTYAGGDIIIFRPKIEVDSITLSYILASESCSRQKYKAGQGHSIVHIYAKDISKLSFNLPPIEEQKAIAQILTTADREIELATIKLNSLRTQKRALMQQLLTGKKRLKI